MKKLLTVVTLIAAVVFAQQMYASEKGDFKVPLEKKGAGKK